MIQNDLLQLAHSITELKLLPGNPRRGDIEAVKRSLEAFGQRKPIVVRRTDNVVIAGNHTLQAAQALGWDEIAVVWVDDDEVTSKAFALADNRTAELGDYDEEALADLINDVGSLNPGLLESSGWDDKAVQELLDRVEQVELPTDVDEVPEDVPAVSKLGDVWLLGDHRVMCGDTTETINMDKLMGTTIADMVFTDPPYNADYSSRVDKNRRKPWGGILNDNMSDVKFAEFISDSLVETKLKLVLNGSIYCWTDWKRYPLVASIFAEEFNHKSTIVWDKGHFGLGTYYRTQYELLLFGVKGEKLGVWKSGHDERDVWSQSREPLSNYVHPTQKPAELAIRAIKNSSDIGHVILDPFGGSGSTLIAAQETKRVAYLMELDPHYVDVICARFQKLTGVLPVLESSGKVHDFLNA
jgi:DNA modification methylase